MATASWDHQTIRSEFVPNDSLRGSDRDAPRTDIESRGSDCRVLSASRPTLVLCGDCCLRHCSAGVCAAICNPPGTRPLSLQTDRQVRDAMAGAVPHRTTRQRIVRYIAADAAAGAVALLIARFAAHADSGIAIAIGVVTALAAVGFELVLSVESLEQARSDIGKGLLVAVLGAVAVLWLQSEIQRSVERSAQHQSEAETRAAQRQSFLLTLSLQHDLEGDNLSWMNLRGVYLGGKDLREAQLQHAILQRALFTRSRLVEANLEEAHAEGVVARGTDLQGANLTKIHARGAGFEEANLASAELHAGEFTEAFFAGANMPGAFLSHARFTGAKLEHTDLDGVTAEETLFEAAHLEQAKLVGAELSGADLNGADLEGANLSGAYLGYADLRSADLESAQLRGARYNADTRWPAGFKPSHHGTVSEP